MARLDRNPALNTGYLLTTDHMQRGPAKRAIESCLAADAELRIHAELAQSNAEPPSMSDDERTPLIGDAQSGGDGTGAGQESTGWTLATVSRRLYVSHFLSTCNSRVFEFGSVLYLAAIFPGTLLPLSVYAVARSASAILLAPVAGYYIDSGDRLRVVRWSIGG